MTKQLKREFSRLKEQKRLEQTLMISKIKSRISDSTQYFETEAKKFTEEHQITESYINSLMKDQDVLSKEIKDGLDRISRLEKVLGMN